MILTRPPTMHEFAVLRVGIHEGVAHEFARALHEALDFEHLGVSVRNAAGYSRFPRDATGIESLMMAAEAGVAHAKTLPDDRLSGTAEGV